MFTTISVIMMTFSIFPLLGISLCLSLFSHFDSTPAIFLFFNFAVIVWFLFIKVYTDSDKSTIFLQNKFIYTSSKYLLSLVFLLLLLKQYGLHFTQDIATVLFISMLCLKLLEIKDHHDRRHISLIIFLQYFSLVISFLNSQDFILLIYNLFVLGFVIFIQIVFSLIPTSQKLINTTQIKQAGKTGVKLFLLAIPFSIFLFIFFPRFPGPLWTLPSLTQQGVTGLSDKMYPGSVNQLSESDEIVFSIKFLDKIPDSNQLYWRGPVLDKTDGFLWEQSYEKDNKLNSKDYSKAALVDFLNFPINYEISLEPQKQKWLFSLEMPSKLTSQSLKSLYLSKITTLKL